MITVQEGQKSLQIKNSFTFFVHEPQTMLALNFKGQGWSNTTHQLGLH